MTVSFLRTKTVDVRTAGDGGLQVAWRLSDDLTDAQIRLTVRPPELEITEATATIARYSHPAYATAADAIARVVGVRIGPGLRKIVTGLMSPVAGADELVEGVLESCNAVILRFTLPHIRAGERMNPDELREASRELLRINPRMLGSCVAWQPDSPLLAELGVEAGGES